MPDSNERIFPEGDLSPIPWEPGIGPEHPERWIDSEGNVRRPADLDPAPDLSNKE